LVELVLAGLILAGLLIWSAGGERRRLGNASLLNAMVGEIEANLNGIAIPRV
jgi:hypothetical protein